jgi:hypothetical protein
MVDNIVIACSLNFFRGLSMQSCDLRSCVYIDYLHYDYTLASSSVWFGNRCMNNFLQDADVPCKEDFKKFVVHQIKAVDTYLSVSKRLHVSTCR